MKAVDRPNWRAKTLRLNAGVELKRGMIVVDSFGHRGVVVRIVTPEGSPRWKTTGFVYVWQSERTDYGSDNCEHYTFTGWPEELRILDAN